MGKPRWPDWQSQKCGYPNRKLFQLTQLVFTHNFSETDMLGWFLNVSAHIRVCVCTCTVALCKDRFFALWHATVNWEKGEAHLMYCPAQLLACFFYGALLFTSWLISSRVNHCWKIQQVILFLYKLFCLHCVKLLRAFVWFWVIKLSNPVYDNAINFWPPRKLRPVAQKRASHKHAGKWQQCTVCEPESFMDDF